MDKRVKKWLTDNRYTEVEVLISDLTGICRGKIIPTDKFLMETVRMPVNTIAQTVTGSDGGYSEEYLDDIDTDMELRPDFLGCYPVPWAQAEPTGQIICDCYSDKGRMITYAPRTVLRRVLKLYQNEDWSPLVAPEIEFYLAKRDNNPDNPLKPPIGRTGRPEFGRQPFSIDAVNEFEDIINDIYHFADMKKLSINTLVHEDGVAQFEINFKHGNPLIMADQVMMFKRCVRESAIKHSMTATFMAKPIESEPGSSMHIHQSVLNGRNENIFSNPSGERSNFFYSYLGGLQTYIKDVQALLLPNVNSYRRLKDGNTSINKHWGENNRTVGFRIPSTKSASNLRIENRICGSDTNPYLAFAASLLSGYWGMKRKIKPEPVIKGTSWGMSSGISLGFWDALENMDKSKILRSTFGNRFVDLYVNVKRSELASYEEVISSWERKFLLLTV